jgi:SpoVK/Ycf46/Vps4 family AAA+-type ATPase
MKYFNALRSLLILSFLIVSSTLLDAKTSDDDWPFGEFSTPFNPSGSRRGSSSRDGRDYPEENHDYLIKPVYSDERIADIAGDVPSEIATIIEYLKNPTLRARYKKFNVDLYKGILLWGPPGTGKTALARAVAGEVKAPFFSVKISDVMSKFVGESEQRITQIFSDARHAAKKSKTGIAILFFDEIDSLASNRDRHQAEWTTSILNTLLAEMDGFEKNKGVIVFAATNRPQSLDPAIKRPGRFDKEIEIGIPSMDKQVAILELYLKKSAYEHNVNKEKKLALIHQVIALLNENKIPVTPVYLKGVVQEAARRAAHEKNIDVIPDRIILQVVRERINEQKLQHLTASINLLCA